MIQNWKHDFYWMHIPFTSPWSQKVIMSNHQKLGALCIQNTQQHKTKNTESEHGNNVTKNFNLHVSRQRNILNQLRGSIWAKEVEHWEEHCPKPQNKKTVVVTGGEEGVGKVGRGIVLGVNPMIYKKKIWLRKVILKQEWCPCFNNQESLNKLQNCLTILEYLKELRLPGNQVPSAGLRVMTATVQPKSSSTPCSGGKRM